MYSKKFRSKSTFRGISPAYREYEVARGSIALLKTFRQIRNEAYGLFMSTATFDIHLSEIKGFLGGICPTRATLMTPIYGLGHGRYLLKTEL